MKTVLCYSGGLDSTVLLYHLRESGYEVSAVGFDYGQWHRRELNAAYEFCLKLDVPFTVVHLDLKFGGSIVGKTVDVENESAPMDRLSGSPTVVPGRNLTFLSCAASYALGQGIDRVAIAAHHGDAAIYPDCRPEFLAAFENLMRATYAKDFHVVRPFLRWSKGAIVNKGKQLGVPFELTWSCYAGETLPCGACGACAERAAALGDWQNQGMKYAARRAEERSRE